MANSKNIGKVISYLKRNYPETDYDDVKYLGIEGSPQNYILYYEKVQRYGMCFHCAYSEECAEYGDQCDRLPTGDPNNDYIIKVQNEVVSEIYDGDRNIRAKYRNDGHIWYIPERRWISKRELEDIRYEEEERTNAVEEEYLQWEKEYRRQLAESKCIIIDIDDFIKDYEIVQGKITIEFNYKVIEQIKQFPISNLVVYIYGGYRSYSIEESLVLYEDVLMKLNLEHIFEKCLNVTSYNIILTSISSRKYGYKDLIVSHFRDFCEDNCFANNVLILDDVVELINSYGRNELLLFSKEINFPEYIKFDLKLNGKKVPHYIINDYIELYNC